MRQGQTRSAVSRVELTPSRILGSACSSCDANLFLLTLYSSDVFKRRLGGGMQVQVKLPLGPAIEVFDLCSAIAQAVWPTEGLKGIDCIDGGLIRASSIAEGNAVLEPSACALPTEMDAGPEVSRSPRATAEGWMAKHWIAAPPIDAGLADVELPIALTEDDRRWLEGVLPDLPSLRYPISDEVRIAFLTAYRNLKERRTWEPCLITDVVVAQRKREQDRSFIAHRNALERMFEAGKLSLFNRQHAPASGFSVRGLIARSAATAYLEQHGFEFGDDMPDAVVPDNITQSNSEVEKVEASDLSEGNPKRRVGVSRHTAAERAAAVKLYWKLKGEGAGIACTVDARCSPACCWANAKNTACP